MVVGFYDKVGWDLEKRNIEVLGFGGARLVVQTCFDEGERGADQKSISSGNHLVNRLP